MNDEEIMILKIKFIDNNKEKIKENILTKIEYDNHTKSLLLVLVKYLLDDTEYICKEYNALKKFVEITPDITINNIVELEDIIGIIKTFINKVYIGTNEETILLNKLKIYDNIINFERKSFIKALV